MEQFRQAAKRIDASDVVSLLREVYPEGVRGRNEAEALIAFDREFVDPAPEWRGFMAEAVADHLLRRSQPASVVTPEKANWLMRTIAPAGRAVTPGGLQALVRTIEQADEIPAPLSAFAIRALWLDGAGRESRPLDAQDVALLRSILEAAKTAVSQEEAEALFDLHDAVAAVRNHAAFDDLFFRAIVNYLANASGCETPPRKEALAREPRRGYADHIGAECAAWLAARIMRDGRPTFAERALLALMDDGAEPDPSSRRSQYRAA
jgi:hypothetical protein